MKNFLQSVLLGFLLGIIYIFMLAFIITPLLFLFKNGFIGLLTGTVNITDFIRNVLGRSMGMIYKIDNYSLTIIIIQILLFFSTCIITCYFLSTVLSVFLKNEAEQFQLFYKIIYYILFIVPEVFIIMSLFFKFPIIKTILIIFIILLTIIIFSIVISNKILNDLLESSNNSIILEGD